MIGLDNLNYDPSLKKARLNLLRAYKRFEFHKLDLAKQVGMEKLFSANRFARWSTSPPSAGSLSRDENPHSYVDSNLVGFLHILESSATGRLRILELGVRRRHRLPFSVHHNVDHPVSLYAATKKANELMAHAYSHLRLRFFTVYGP